MYKNISLNFFRFISSKFTRVNFGDKGWEKRSLHEVYDSRSDAGNLLSTCLRFMKGSTEKLRNGPVNVVTAPRSHRIRVAAMKNVSFLHFNHWEFTAVL